MRFGDAQPIKSTNYTYIVTITQKKSTAIATASVVKFESIKVKIDGSKPI